jgi:hypothetical protein
MMASCLNPPDYPTVPHIEFDSLTKTFVKGAEIGGQVVPDSIIFFISFTDGDGDLGPIGNDSAENLFFRDNRTGFVYPFQFPYITPDGNIKDISGTIAYTLSPFFCNPGKTIDTLSYTIYIRDRAGNFSNEVTSPDIVCDCN